jgi:hypothetical protein
VLLGRLVLFFSLAAAGCTRSNSTPNPELLRANGETPEDEIGFYVSGGSVFAPLLEVENGAVVEWHFVPYKGGIVNTVTGADSATPSANYTGGMLATLKVLPWKALTTIDIGYDGNDGGTLGPMYQRSNQYVTELAHLYLAKDSLRIWCSSHNTELNSLSFKDFKKLRIVEIFFSEQEGESVGLESIDLRGANALVRLCVENNDLVSLDLTDCTALEDLRGALNAYTSIKWPSACPKLWHVCLRENPQLTNAVPVDRMPALQECFLWNAGQAGTFKPNSTVLTEVLIWENTYTTIDLRESKFASENGEINARNSSIESVFVGSSGVRALDLSANSLDDEAIARLLSDLVSSGVRGGTLILSQNPGRVDANSEDYRRLRDELGWTITSD